MDEAPWEQEVAVPLAVLIVVVLAGGLAAVVHLGTTSTAVDLDETLEGFRQDRGSSGSSSGAEEPAPGTPEAPPDDAAEPSAQTAPAPAAEAPQEAQGPPGAIDPREPAGERSEPQPFTLPAPGVYRYVATGGEEVGAPGGDRGYPSESFATVRHRGGCEWEFEHRVARERTERRTYCSRAGELVSLVNETEVTFYGRTERGRLTCDPPRILLRHGDGAGTSRQVTCRSGQDESRETITYEGRVTIDIGGDDVHAHRIRIDARFSGRATGESRINLWLHPDTGLLLRTERWVSSRTDAFGAGVRYDEEATFQLASLDPQT